MVARLLLLLATLALAMPAFGAEPQMSSVRIVVPSRDIARGEIIGAGDLSYLTVADSASYAGLVTAADDLEGLEARRVLRAGEAIRPSDVRRPILVERGATVTMTFEAPGIAVTAMGKALSEGGLGETINVQNIASYRQVSAVVTGSGQVRALGAGMTIMGPGARVAAVAGQ